jgi:hypothetical protein
VPTFIPLKYVVLCDIQNKSAVGESYNWHTREVPVIKQVTKLAHACL